MAKIISISPRENFLKSLYRSFRSLDLFTKTIIISFLLIILVTPSVIKNYQIFNPYAQFLGSLAQETWEGVDASAWPAQWNITVDADKSGSADILASQGRLQTVSDVGPYDGPFVKAQIPTQIFSSVDLRLLAEYVSGTPLKIRAFAGSATPITLVFDNNGNYNVYKNETTQIIDGTSVGKRPPPCLSDKTCPGPWWVRLKIERNYNATDIYVKRWSKTAAEPAVWHHMKWQDSDSVLFSAVGPIELEVEKRGSSWLIDDLTVAEIPLATALSKTTPVNSIDATSDLHIPYDGRDVSLILPQALANLPLGSVVYFEPGGVYGIEQTALFNDLGNVRLVGQKDASGQRTIFKRFANGNAWGDFGDSSGSYLQCNNCTNVTFEGFEITGPEPVCTYDVAYDSAAGIGIGGGNNITVKDSYIHHVGGDGVQIGGLARNVTVSDTRTNCTRRQGMSANDFDGVLLENNLIEWPGRSGIDVEPYASNWIANNLTIRNNTIRHITNWGIAALGAGTHDGTTVENNTVTGGLGFMTIKGSRISVKGNNYNWNDEYDIKKTRSGTSIEAADSVYVGSNILKEFSENPVKIYGTGGMIESNTFASGTVDIGLSYDCSISLSNNNVFLRDEVTNAQAKCVETGAGVAVIPTPTPTPTLASASTPTPTPGIGGRIVLLATPTATLVPTDTPIPTPTPTPIPVACAITSASWAFDSNPTAEGTTVRLNVITNNSSSCTGQKVAFDIRKDNGLLGSEPVDINPSPSDIVAGNAGANWVAEFHPNGLLGLFGSPQYYFNASIAGDTATVKSNDPKLTVDKLVTLAFPGWGSINTIFYTTSKNNNQIILDTVKELKASLEPAAGKVFSAKNLGQNVALGKTRITSSVPPDRGWPGLPYLVDGDAVLFSNNYVPLGTGKQWVQIDLEDVFLINKVNIRHNYADGRTYKDVAVQVSEDGINWTTIFNNDTDNSLGFGAGTDSEYASGINGKDIVLASPVRAQYIKTWSNGSNVNQQNFYIEIEAYGTYVTAPSQTNGIFLTIDPSFAELASKKSEAFKTYTDSDGLHIVGKNPFAVRNGVYSLLDKLGYRWYFLHPAWSVSPISLQDMDINEIKEPFFLERAIGAGLSTSALSVDPNGSVLYGNWLKRNRMISDSVYQVHHSWPDFANKNDVKIQDPSAVCYKADGVTPQQVLPDSPTVIARALNYARSWLANPLARNPYTGDWQTKQVVPVSPPDGNAIWCNEWLKDPADPGDYDPQLVSDKVFGLTNEVAKTLQTEYPGKYAGVMSYSWYPLAPSYNILPNIYANVTTFTRGTTLAPGQRLSAMKAKGVLTGFYDYFDVWAWWKDRIEPAGKYAVFLKALKEAVDIKADVLEVEGSDNWGPKGRLYWIVSRYAWDPTQTFDTLLDDFYANAFGPAKDIMKRYYTRFDTQWLDQYSDAPDNNRVMGLAFRDINEAMVLTASDPKIQERLRQVLYYTYFWWKWGDTVSGTNSDTTGYDNFRDVSDAQEMYKFLWKIRDMHLVQFRSQENAVRLALQSKYGLTNEQIALLQNPTPPTRLEAAAWLAAGIANWLGQDLIEASLIDASKLNLSAANADTPSVLQAIYYRQPSTRYEAWDGTNIIVSSSGNETIPVEVMLLASGPTGGAGPVTLEWVSPSGAVLASKVISYVESGYYPTFRPAVWNVQTTVAGRYALRSTTHNGWVVNIDRGTAHDISQDGIVSADRQGYFYVPAGTPSLIVGLSSGSLTVTSPNNISYTATNGEKGFRNPEAGFWKLEIPRETNVSGNVLNKKVWILGVAPLVWHDPKYLLIPVIASPENTPTPIPTALSCAVSSGAWVTRSNPVVQGTQIILSVRTNNAPSCVGKKIAVDIRKDNGLLPSESVDINPDTFDITKEVNNTNWVAEFHTNGLLGIFGSPQYYFNASIAGDSKIVKSADPKLKVDKAERLTIASTPQAVASSQSAVITWDTNLPSSSWVAYGINSLASRATSEEHISSKVLSHQVTIQNLKSCTSYHYIVASKDESSNIAKSSDNKFVTLGCNASVIEAAESNTAAAINTGGQLNLYDSFSRGVDLSVPPLFSTTNTYFQILKLNKNEFVNKISAPTGFRNIGEHTYHFNAFGSDEETKISSFDKNIDVEIKYDTSDLEGVDENSLIIQRWDGEKWNGLSNCIVDTVNKSVKCKTNAFSDFALLGQPLPSPTPTPTPTQAPSGGVGGSSGGGGSGGGGSSSGGGSSPAVSGGSSDINRDGRTNIFDLSMLLRNWNRAGAGDLNSDGRVNIFDLSILLRSWSR